MCGGVAPCRGRSRGFVLRSLFAGLAGCLLFWTSVAAAPPKPLEISAYGGLPAIDFMQLAPSGAKVAWVSVAGEARSLVVEDLAGKVILSAPLGTMRVRYIAWAGDEHLLVAASQTQHLDIASDKDEFFHVVALNLSTGTVITVFANREDIFSAVFGNYGSAEVNGRWYGFFGGVTLSKTHGFEASLNSESYADLYRVDLDTGRSELVEKARLPRDWVIDSAGSVVAYSEYERKSGSWRLYAGAGGPPMFTAISPHGRDQPCRPRAKPKHRDRRRGRQAGVVNGHADRCPAAGQRRHRRLHT